MSAGKIYLFEISLLPPDGDSGLTHPWIYVTAGNLQDLLKIGKHSFFFLCFLYPTVIYLPIFKNFLKNHTFV